MASRPHDWTIGLSIGAILVSLCSAGIAFYSMTFAEKQYKLALQVRQDNLEGAKRQKKALEDAAQAAQENLKLVQKSASAAEASAQAGHDALLLSRRALVLDNIPAMHVFDNRLIKPLTAGEPPTVTTRITNLGKGIAYKLEAQQWVKVQQRREFTYEKAATPPSRTDVPPTTIFDLNSTLPKPLTEEHLKLIRSGNLAFYVYGRVTYFDSTLEKPRKYTWLWCEYYLDEGPNKQLLNVCPEHNSTTVE
jgi:hypothetical protein